jgi:hypothetical protein
MMDILAVAAIGFQDGSVGRMQLFDGSTDEQIQAQIDQNAETWAALGLKAVSWHRCDLSDFPVESHDFRAAWTVVDEKIVIDMDKAKEITRQRLRDERGPILAKKDIDALKAVEVGDTKALAAVSAEKQRLRDITKLPAIDAAKTADDLRAISLT